MPDRFPGYDVLSKRDTPSWNEQTRRVIAERLALPDEPRFFEPHEYETVKAIAARLVPQPPGRWPIPVAALVDHKLHLGRSDGYRQAGMPRERDEALEQLAEKDRVAAGVDDYDPDQVPSATE